MSLPTKCVRASIRGIPIWLCHLIAVVCIFVANAAGQTSPRGSNARDISDLAPEGRMKLRGTRLANHGQALLKVGSAPDAITREDIASSGANSIPDRSQQRSALVKLTWRL
jgi:hypothetical protein